MMITNTFTYFVVGLTAGCGAGAALFWVFQKIRLGSFQQMAADIIKKGEAEVELIKKNQEIILKQQALEQQQSLEQLRQAERRKLQKEGERLKQREDLHERRISSVEKKIAELDKKEAVLVRLKNELETTTANLEEQKARVLSELEQLSGLSVNEARELLLSKITNEVKTDAANLIRRTKKEAEEEADREASRIIATAINRLAVPCVSEATVNTVSIPSEEMKGRIIGKEGRNIRTLERATGINFIIDDTPGAIVLSGFDPVRMHVAKMAITELVVDGRIHPTRIEEVVEKARINTHKLIKQYGEDAALRAGAINLHPELIQLLGKLKFRFSYGQNVLDHSLEVSYLMGMMAAELGLDIRLAKRIGILHDMGKAVTHEVEGSHALIGRDLALKYGESKEVANGIGCHHFEIEADTIEASLCSSADSISASLLGARCERVEEYIKRLTKLEEMAMEFHGVEKAYALQAGREVRVVVVPDILDDAGTVMLARDLTKKIEQELSYPGKIKVTVIREKRAIEYAV